VRHIGIGLAIFLGWITMAGTPAFPADPTFGEEHEVRKDPNIEHLLMEGTEIQGTVEKPHVVYIVPWKEIHPLTQGEIPLRRSFREEILEPVDRDRFHRQLKRSSLFRKEATSNE